MKWSIGLMSGTALDGIDVALLKTDGENIFEQGPSVTIPYTLAFNQKLHAMLGKDPSLPEVIAVERELTELHAKAIEHICSLASLTRDDIAVVGFHGQTLWHKPCSIYRPGATCQIGDGEYLAQLTGIDVVNQFRRNDVAQGGEGAPLVPIYHLALARDLSLPVMMVNIGGISNVTWIGSADPSDLVAFDTGPGNCLIDQWIFKHTGEAFDPGGRYARQGKLNQEIADRLLVDCHINQRPPKAFDRLSFNLDALKSCSVEDGAAILAYVTATCIAAAEQWVPAPVKSWIVMGGGRYNLALLEFMQQHVSAKVSIAEDFGWNSDAIEAQAFAYLAQRSLRGLPLSFPNTTGVALPTTGGELHRAVALVKQAR